MHLFLKTSIVNSAVENVVFPWEFNNIKKKKDSCNDI